jgi:hypothetical protein
LTDYRNIFLSPRIDMVWAALPAHVRVLKYLPDGLNLPNRKKILAAWIAKVLLGPVRWFAICTACCDRPHGHAGAKPPPGESFRSCVQDPRCMWVCVYVLFVGPTIRPFRLLNLIFTMAMMVLLIPFRKTFGK